MTKSKKTLITVNRNRGSFGNLIPNIPAKDPHQIKTKQQQIVNGACEVFLKKGFHSTTIREIAEECGMSMGQLYHYISSKDDVLFLMHRHFQQVLYDYLKGLSLEEEEDPLELLVKAIRRVLGFISENRKLVLFVYTESRYLEKKYLQAVLAEDNESVVGFWRNILRRLKKEKGIQCNQEFAANLIAYLMVFFVLRGWNLRDIPENEKIASLTDFILAGLGIDHNLTS